MWQHWHLYDSEDCEFIEDSAPGDGKVYILLKSNYLVRHWPVTIHESNQVNGESIIVSILATFNFILIVPLMYPTFWLILYKYICWRSIMSQEFQCYVNF